MKTYIKNYIGKGTQNPKLDIVKVTLRMDQVLNFKHEYAGSEYITFEVAKMVQPDKFGRTHTAYVTSHETVKKPKKAKSS